eukprot:TRINITY_DN23694_c0_g1_i1.p1 TRINITY_DN23694_c0_g1~~TRINITY_DN23694_c0_g1_i1.p1  ORF type:complete len:128 (-),score=29.84 TRINITY_DN23694_c0_g1_i1:273-656(-)
MAIARVLHSLLGEEKTKLLRSALESATTRALRNELYRAAVTSIVDPEDQRVREKHALPCIPCLPEGPVGCFILDAAADEQLCNVLQTLMHDLVKACKSRSFSSGALHMQWTARILCGTASGVQQLVR